jgi:ABC-type sugar transport system ATPase subunit
MGKLKMSTIPVDAVTAWLSGGNQQRVLFAKTLAQGPRVLLLDEPTRGVDIGARESIYQMIRDEADRGVGIVVATSDLEEAWDIADRVVVFRQGRIVGEVTPAAGGSRGQVLRLALGAQDVDIGVVVGEALSEQGQTAISEFD